MDQGLAAVLGAAVGAIATAGGAFLTARSAERLHRRQTRRQCYLGFIQEADELSTLLRQTREMFRDCRPAADLEATQVNEALEGISNLFKSVQRHRAAIALEGPDELVRYVDLAVGDAYQMLMALRGWRDRYLDASVPEDENRRVQDMERMTNHIARFEMNARRHV